MCTAAALGGEPGRRRLLLLIRSFSESEQNAQFGGFFAGDGDGHFVYVPYDRSPAIRRPLFLAGCAHIAAILSLFIASHAIYGRRGVSCTLRLANKPAPRSSRARRSGQFTLRRPQFNRKFIASLIFQSNNAREEKRSDHVRLRRAGANLQLSPCRSGRGGGVCVFPIGAISIVETKC